MGQAHVDREKVAILASKRQRFISSCFRNFCGAAGRRGQTPAATGNLLIALAVVFVVASAVAQADGLSDCVGRRMNGQHPSEAQRSLLACRKETKAEFVLWKDRDFKYSYGYAANKTIIDIDAGVSDDIDLTSGDFLFSEKPCNEAQPGDMVRKTATFNGRHAIIEGTPKYSCARTGALPGRTDSRGRSPSHSSICDTSSFTPSAWRVGFGLPPPQASGKRSGSNSTFRVQAAEASMPRPRPRQKCRG
jgi:hypothetical protein